MQKIEVNHGQTTDRGLSADTLVMRYEQRSKGRIKLRSEQGTEVGLFLERGKVLRDGDVLESTEGLFFRVKAREEPLIRGVCDNWELFARCCYHLGNRHVPVQIGHKELWIQADHILSDMLSQLGMDVSTCEASFSPEQGAYAGGHGHHHEH
ncbi:MAG: urease accessory protein UreE [Oleiphilus sp.]|nr:MAG: urease accessory protein UreE [Oleiphilus sp.]